MKDEIKYPEGWAPMCVPRYAMGPHGQMVEVTPWAEEDAPVNPAWTAPEVGATGRTFHNDTWYWILWENGNLVEVPMEPQPPHLLDL